MVKQQTSVQKLFFTMENLSWSWQGMLTVSRLIKSLPGVTGFHPHRQGYSRTSRTEGFTGWDGLWHCSLCSSNSVYYKS